MARPLKTFVPTLQRFCRRCGHPAAEHWTGSGEEANFYVCRHGGVNEFEGTACSKRCRVPLGDNQSMFTTRVPKSGLEKLTKG